LFGKKKGTDTAPASPEIGLLGAGTRFEGRIRFRGTLRLDGSVRGDIRSEQGSGSVLVINRNAAVVGSVVSDSVLISGRLEGDVVAQQSVEIFRDGRLTGDIYTGAIMIESGAEFQGGCHMIRDLPAEQRTELLDRVLGHREAPAADADAEAPAKPKSKASA
jgi:cytoskeletal protein CcmA (bactofilin family)